VRGAGFIDTDNGWPLDFSGLTEGPQANFSSNCASAQEFAHHTAGDDPPILTGPRQKGEQVVKRGLLVAVGGAAIVVAGVAGCSSSNQSTSESTTSVAAATPSATVTASVSGGPSAAMGAGTAKVTIDGQDQNIQGTVVCANAGGDFSITVGQGMSAVVVRMAEDASAVHQVALGNINGVALGYTEGVGTPATATKDGTHYNIKGEATGTDMANPTQPVTKPFEIDVSCPA
jgi:lipoprotein LpqH